jgi:hypothetical protein
LRKKKAKSKITKKDFKTPGSVRKSAVPVKSRVKLYESVLRDEVQKSKLLAEKMEFSNESATEIQNSSKRKLVEDIEPTALTVYPADLHPRNGFQWIDSETIRTKKIKLDTETIVKKRIEYFQVFMRLILETWIRSTTIRVHPCHSEKITRSWYQITTRSSINTWQNSTSIKTQGTIKS